MKRKRSKAKMLTFQDLKGLGIEYITKVDDKRQKKPYFEMNQCKILHRGGKKGVEYYYCKNCRTSITRYIETERSSFVVKISQNVCKKKIMGSNGNNILEHNIDNNLTRVVQNNNYNNNFFYNFNSYRNGNVNNAPPIPPAIPPPPRSFDFMSENTELKNNNNSNNSRTLPWENEGKFTPPKNFVEMSILENSYGLKFIEKAESKGGGCFMYYQNLSKTYCTFSYRYKNDGENVYDCRKCRSKVRVDELGHVKIELTERNCGGVPRKGNGSMEWSVGNESIVGKKRRRDERDRYMLEEKIYELVPSSGSNNGGTMCTILIGTDLNHRFSSLVYCLNLVNFGVLFGYEGNYKEAKIICVQSSELHVSNNIALKNKIDVQNSNIAVLVYVPPFDKECFVNVIVRWRYSNIHGSVKKCQCFEYLKKNMAIDKKKIILPQKDFESGDDDSFLNDDYKYIGC